MAGRLTLSWANKERTLVSTPEGGHQWVEPGDPRASEVRLLDEVARAGDAQGTAGDNLLIVGDSLDALRALALTPEYAAEYRGKVKLVYIDPPFNTGQAFAHYDDALEHSVWLGMMRERLSLINDLLAPDGSVWVHLDDAEMAYCKVLMDEVFGRANFVASFVWQKADSPSSNNVPIATYHDFILVFAKDAGAFRANPMVDPAVLDAYPGHDDEGRLYRDRLLRKNGKSSLRSERPSMWFPIQGPDGKAVWPVDDDDIERRWAVGETRVNELSAAGELIWKERRRKDGSSQWVPYTREYAPEVPKRPWPTLWNDVLMNRQAKAQVKAIVRGVATFDTPKPEQLLERVLQIASSPGDIVLDCFAGSGTTAAVAHKMGRRWVSAELSESTVATFTKPRLEQVVRGEDAGGITASTGWAGGGGFRQMKVAPSLFEVRDEGSSRLVVLSENADESTLARSVAAQLGYLPHEGDAEPFSGRKGRSRLAVVRGVADEEFVGGLLTALDEGETVLVAATMVAPGADAVLRRHSRGSRTLRIPSALFANSRVTR